MSDLLRRGMELGREGRWEEATDLLRQVVWEDAGNFEAWLWLGAMVADPQDAVDCLEKAVTLRPTSIRAQKGIEWAREKLLEAKATEAPSSSSAAPGGAIDPSAPFAEGSATTGPEVFPTRTSPTGPQSENEEIEGVAPSLNTEDSSLETPTVDGAWWKRDDAFPNEGPLPISPADEDVISPPPASETYRSGLIELPRAILSAFQQDENLGEEENPPSVPPVGAIDEDPYGASSLNPPGEQYVLPPPEVTMRPEEFSTKLPLFDEGTVESLSDTLGGVGAEPPASLGEPVDLGPANPSAESWDALIARLQSLDGQPPVESEQPIASGAADATSDDLPSGPDLLSSPPQAPFVAEAPAADQPDANAIDLAMAAPLPEPLVEAKASALAERAKLDLEAGRLIEAMERLKQAIALDANNVEANEQLGIVQYQAGNLDAAVAAFQTVVGLRPNQAEGHANLGFLFAEKGEPDAAIGSFREAIRCDGELAEAYLGLADLYKGRGDLNSAIEQWREATRLRPDWTDALANLAEAYAELGQIENAIREYHSLAKQKPGDDRSHLRLGQLLWKRGTAEEAAKEFREALRLAPALAEAHYGLACSLEEMGSWGEAVSELEKALAIKPGFLEADEKLERLKAAMTMVQEDAKQKEEKQEQEKKPRWRFFGRDK